MIQNFFFATFLALDLSHVLVLRNISITEYLEFEGVMVAVN
jgi:hypothetical protein